MAEKVTIGGQSQLFIGEDKTVKLEVLQKSGDGTISTTPQDMTGWTVKVLVKNDISDADVDAVLTETAAITGTYNAVRATNTQRAAITLTDTETEVLTAKSFHHSWKRTDDGSETILAHGPCRFEKTTQVA